MSNPRQKNIKDMLQFIENQGGATFIQIQKYMWTVHGLKRPTITQYLKECQSAGFIKIDGMTFRVIKDAHM